MGSRNLAHRMSIEDYNFVERFLEARGKRYDPCIDGLAPPWDDGSDVAALLAIRQIEGMIGNGAWPAVYYNRIGWLVPLAANGYRMIGMEVCAERCDLAMQLVRRAEEAHPEMDHQSDAWRSDGLMEAVGEDGWDRLDIDWYKLTARTYEFAAAYIRGRYGING